MDDTKSKACVRLRHLLAMLPAVSTEKTRYYLNGIYIDPHKDGGAVMTATDGHKLVSIYDPNAICVGKPQIWSISQNVAELKAAEKRFKADWKRLSGYDAWCRFEDRSISAEQSDFRLALAYASGSVTETKPDDWPDHKKWDPIIGACDLEWDGKFCRPIATNVAIDGTFPDYARVFPTIETDHVTLVINSRYASEIGKIVGDFRTVKTAPVSLVTTGADSAAVFMSACTETGSRLVGLVMPMRGQFDRDLKYYPDWLVAHTGRSSLGAPDPETVQVNQAS
jgi:hypothetical protein